MVLAGLTLQMAQEVSLHGGRPDALSPAQAAAVDAVEVLLINHRLEALTSSLPRLHARQALAKRAATVQATTLAYLQVQDAAPKAPVIMANFPPAPALVAQTRSAAVWTRYRPGIPGRYRNRPSAALDGGNLVLGQAQQNLRVGQNVISQDCFINPGIRACPRF